VFVTPDDHCAVQAVAMHAGNPLIPIQLLIASAGVGLGRRRQLRQNYQLISSTHLATICPGSGNPTSGQ
jgi:hypothetical protein